MVLFIVAGAILGFTMMMCLIFICQGLVEYLWQWWHYILPDWKTKRLWRKRYREFEKRNRQ